MICLLSSLLSIIFIIFWLRKDNSLFRNVIGIASVAILSFFLYNKYNTFEQVIYHIVFTITFMCSIIDYKTHLIPDKYSYVLLVLGLIIRISEPIYIIISIIIFIITLTLIQTIEDITKSYLLGGGDCKLIFALSFFCHDIRLFFIALIICFYVLFFKSLFEKIFFKKDIKSFAFAPFITISFIISVIMI